MRRVSRRAFALQVLTAGGALTLGARARDTEAETTSTPSEALDEALELLKDSGPEYGGGLANHGPMAAEALAALGRADAVIPWVSAYKRRLDAPPAPWKPITEAGWREALGDVRHAADWPRYFEVQLAEEPWPQVLETWTARLAPGLVAAATHGVIRTGHAARALAARDTPARRKELAAGLGYWATRYETLPSGKAGAAGVKLTVSEALPRVPVLPPDRRSRGFITDRLRPLVELPAFAPIVDLVDTTGDPSRVLSDIARAFAGAYLAHAGSETIAFIHAVTGPSALRPMLPHLSPRTAKDALRYAWQAAAAIYGAHARAGARTAALGPVPGVEGLIAEAVETGDEHAIKFTEACLREHRIAPAPELLAAAQDACGRLRA